jgi:hypothetical protein
VKLPRRLKPGARVVIPGKVHAVNGDDVWVDGEFGTVLYQLKDLGKTWDRAPRARARRKVGDGD